LRFFQVKIAHTFISFQIYQILENTQMEKETYSISDVSRKYSLSRTGVWRLLKSGVLPAVQVGSKWIIHRESADRMFLGGKYKDKNAA
jgi:hypothetical protein